MVVTVLTDSFKGSLSAIRAGEAIEKGIKRVFSDALVHVCPIADGGEGTSEAIVHALGGHFKTVTVKNPLGKPIKSRYGILPKTNTAVIETADAAGLTLLDEKDRNPMHTTTYGVGELILDALSEGLCHFIIGIGGSATNDGGVGMLQALGFSFLDHEQNEVPFGAKGLLEIAEIKTQNADPRLKNCHFEIALDVENGLLGEAGAGQVFGPQKGAGPKMVPLLDASLAHFSEQTQKINPAADPSIPGAGAGGGLGFGLMSYLKATKTPGIDLVLRETNAEAFVKEADLVVTGEGSLDAQTLMGKAPLGVARLAKKHQKPVIALAGKVSPKAYDGHDHGIDAIFPILKGPCSVEEAMHPETAFSNLTDTAEEVFRLIRAVG